jgi:hypothetical protein
MSTYPLLCYPDRAFADGRVVLNLAVGMMSPHGIPAICPSRLALGHCQATADLG